MKLGVQPGHILIVSIYCQGILSEVVGAKGDEVYSILNEVLNGQSGAWCLDHDSYIDLIQVQALVPHYGFGLLELADMLDHGQHDAHIGQAHLMQPLEGFDLQAEVIGLGHIPPDAPPTQHGVVLMRLSFSAFHGPELVRGGIQSAHPDRPGIESIGNDLDAIDQLRYVLLSLPAPDIPVGCLAHA